MRPAILQTDSLNRVAFDPDAGAAHLETFFLHLSDPKHPRSVTLRLTLCSQGPKVPAQNGRFGEVEVIYTEAGKAPRLAKERWPVNRVQIDPERAGVGIGESNVQENASAGLVRADSSVISWDFKMAGAAPGYQSLPSQWLHRGARVTPKLCTPNPGSRIVRGRMEIWGGHSRHVPVTHIDLTGWDVMQGHRFGPDLRPHHAWVHCSAFTGAPADTYFEAYSGAIALGRLLRPQALLGRLVVGGKVFHFDTWRNLFGTAARCSPSDWQFSLQGPQGRVLAKVHAAPHQTAATVGLGTGGAQCHTFTNGLANLTVELQPTGEAPQTLQSSRAAYEVSLPAPRGALGAAA
jgi:hypothetical protein